jgi:hypothetical protein
MKKKILYWLWTWTCSQSEQYLTIIKITIGVVIRLHIGNDNIILDFPHTFGNIHYKEFINK